MTKTPSLTPAMRQVYSASRWFRGYRIAMLVFLLCAVSVPAFSQEDDSKSSSNPLVSLWNQQSLLGDFAGARTRLAENKGISFSGFWQNDFFADPSVGNSHGNTGTGNWSRIRATMDIDMGKLAHMNGLSLHITTTLNQGLDVGYDGRYMGSLMGATGNDTINHQLRLDSWWVKQDLFHSKLSLYVGQISGADFFGFLPQDFSHFVTLGPFYAPLALYNSFSNFDPMSTPAAMIQITPNKHFYYRTMFQSITEGNPSDPNAVLGFYNWFNNSSGTNTEMKDGAVWHNEVAYLYGSGEAHFGVSYSGAKAYTKWSGNASNGTLVTLPGFAADSSAGNENYYWIWKQTVYRPSAGSHRGVDLGGTFVYGPEDKGVLPYNRQLVLTAEFNGLLPGRPKDSINFAYDYLGIRGPLKTPIFQSEKVYEFNYSFQVTRWLQWMPDLQVHEDIGANPKNGTGVVVGFRSLVTF
jgi:carbohydrate-selective porin OprB